MKAIHFNQNKQQSKLPKTISFTSLLLFILCFGCLDQTFEKEHILKNQNEVNQFGKLNKSEISGSVLIYDATDLSPLNSIKKISGDLKIGYRDSYEERDRSNEKLKSLNGLNNLEHIGRDLIIERTSINSLKGLANLESVNGQIHINHNNFLNSFEGFENLTSIKSHFTIKSNKKLTSLKGLEGLSIINGGFYIFGNSSLTSLRGLDNLSLINGYLLIDRNNSLISITSLKNIITINNYLRINNNDSLPSLNGLQNLQIVGDDLEIDNNKALKSLDGLIGIKTVVGDLQIKRNPLLKSLDGLDNIEVVKGDLELGCEKDFSERPTRMRNAGNSKLQDFCSLNELEIKGKAFIKDNLYNPTLEQIKDLTKCKK